MAHKSLSKEAGGILAVDHDATLGVDDNPLRTGNLAPKAL
jgi:hypothetical protein